MTNLEHYFHSLIRGDQRGIGPALLRGGLRALSMPWGFAVRARNRAFDQGWLSSHEARVPVVSVGNLTLGGTGKTPCVEYIARIFLRHELRVAILSRGYGARSGTNDEALVLEENLPDVPHLQGPNRAALAEIAVQELESEVLIMDDGFQHRRLKRDLDVVLIDATNPWGHGKIFPAGLLREPPSSLRRADVIIVTHCNLVQHEKREKLGKQVKRWAPAAPVAESRHRPTGWINAAGQSKSLDELIDRPATAFCGIGNPQAFLQTLTALGLNVSDFHAFPDHCNYTRTDVEDMQAWARILPKDGIILTTQKDLVKLRLTHLGERELWALRIELHLETGQHEMEEKLEEVCVAATRERNVS